jgi:hypothetical protein
MMELRDILEKPGICWDFEGVSGRRTEALEWLCTGWLWLRPRALRMSEFAERVSSSSESWTAGRWEADVAEGGIAGAGAAGAGAGGEPSVDSDDPWRARAVKTRFGVEMDKDID